MNFKLKNEDLYSFCLLEQNTFVKGNIELEVNMRINGKVKGNVISQKKIILGKYAQVDGDVSCSELIVEGNILGNIKTTDDLIIKNSAVVSGKITCKTIKVEEGAKLNGTIHSTQ
ncbi:hypothetical protein DF185_09295 [Marinifilum breve]|uniref:Polymer-forming cytoskeletal protein n=1 Tax=Marinifilum breve TaxID=2184082 RepID=A0A2V3ZYT5_9BACT|nr:polymer-forming cytoskeletal protein [Marinifilum breve]PXY01652.1 hypothetical protein DF185_09295 [Marinifilum breve]